MGDTGMENSLNRKETPTFKLAWQNWRGSPHALLWGVMATIPVLIKEHLKISVVLMIYHTCYPFVDSFKSL